MKTYIICIQTLCGKISPAGFGSFEDRRLLERWREMTDATLLGAGSLRDGDPEFRNSLGKIPVNRIRAIVTSSGRLPFGKNIFHKGPAPFVFCSQKVLCSLGKSLGNRARLFPVKEISPGELDLIQISSILGEHGVKRLLIEGGGRLNYLALKQGVVDELVVTVAPKLLTSNRGTPLVDGDENLGNPFMNLELLAYEAQPTTGELFLRYRIIKESDSG